MQKRKYLFYTRAASGGGAEATWSLLASHFAAVGHAVVLAVDEGEPKAASLDGRVRLEVLGASHRRSLGALRRLLRDFAPDVALSALSANAVKLAAARLLSGRRTPLVFSFHGAMEHQTGRLGHAAYRYLPLLSRLSSRIVAVSDGLRDELVRDWGADPRKAVRIYNPVRLQPAAESLAALVRRPPVIAAVGRLSPEKGFDLLVDAFLQVRTPEATLRIAGEGPERGRLEAQIAASGLGGRVELLGFVDPAPLYATARLAAVPSRSEAFGLAAAEALSAGLPLVVSDCDGPREIVANGAFGTIVPVGDTGAMASAIDAVLALPGDPAPRVERAQSFSTEAGFAAWTNLLDAVADGR